MPDDKTLDADLAPEAGAPTPTWMPARYVMLASIGQGASGEVLRVLDRELQRPVAMKVLRAGASNAAMDRFVAEARRTAGVQHPAVVPVYDLGRLPDGRPWFTMREIVGTPFSAAFRAMHAASTPLAWGAASWSFRRLVNALEVVARGVGHAHARGVLHRDLNPANLVLGEDGEAVVVDWGVAAVVGEATGVVGTIPWMAPEQARGEPLTAATDTYGLGAVLHALLTGNPPLPHGATLAQARAAARPARAERPTAGPTPDELGALCDRALDVDPTARPADGRAFADALRAWLDGEHRREQADAIIATVRDEPAAIAAERDAVAALRDDAARRLAALPPSADAAAKAPAWALEEDADARTAGFELREARYGEALQAALRLDPDHRDARAALADLAAAQVVAAEAAGDEHAVTRSVVTLATWDDGRYARLIRGDGAVTLVTDPPGARVRVERYEARGGVLVPVPVGELGPTPIVAAPLAPGSYRLVLEADGHAPVVYPVWIRRGQAWDGVPPGGDAPWPIVLPRIGELDEGDCYVPAGWFTCGGDPEAPDPYPTTRLWADAFVIRRDPVTVAEYFAFLQDQPEEIVAALGPTDDTGTPRLAWRREGGRVVPAPVIAGVAMAPDEPIVYIPWSGAAAYARWYAARTGRPWRLPHDVVWEKAARGVDARPFPWGRRFDPALMRMNASGAPPGLVAVGQPAADTSPYGVRGLAGNSRDWCGNPWAPGPPALIAWEEAPRDPMTVRGGCWLNGPAFCRVAGRLVANPDRRYSFLGFRLAAPFRGSR